MAAGCGSKGNKQDQNTEGATTVIRDTVFIQSPAEESEKAVSLSFDKMKVIYIGVDNPISLSSTGIPVDELKVSSSGFIKLTDLGNGKFNATATKPGDATIKVSSPGMDTQSWTVSLKRIPDPVARLENKPGQRIGHAEFKSMV